ILKLPKTYRNIIYLHYYEGYQIKEIAEILGMNSNTVGSYLRRARQKLKTNLTEGGNTYGYEPI
ncbi:MAG: sigma-70 family RNA polymerase sigma factor, partial [Ruminococcus sp.]|nr:sigma-70 family RNA polymerase sigma factor [Ruminococcus sp.]